MNKARSLLPALTWDLDKDLVTLMAYKVSDHTSGQHGRDPQAELTD